MDVLTFQDQNETCENCNETAPVDTILDRDTGRYYWFCPHCEAGNAAGG